MGDLFLNRDPASTSPKWSESMLQAYVVMVARRAGYIVHGDQNGAAKSGASARLAKVTGMQPGWPDLCFAVPGAPVWIELKLTSGRLSDRQIEIHDHMRAMGYAVHTVYAESPADAWNQVRVLLPDLMVIRAQKVDAD